MSWMSPKQALPTKCIISIYIRDLRCASMRQHSARFPIEGNDTFWSEIEAHEGLRFASIRLDPPRVDFPWARNLEAMT
jgi:hypothetical protein